ncbi:MAG: glucose-6-phosphate dehydrogenase assembly protein OpcA [Anaerolineae bacterium]
MQPRVEVKDPQAVERVLGELRQASLAATGPSLPPVRLTSLNLIAYAGTRAQIDGMAQLAAALADQHPSRAVFIAEEPDSEGWQFRVWAQCRPTLPGTVVCFEAVEIVAAPASLPRVPAVVLPLLLRDLPAVLWWPGDVPTDTVLFQRLMASADRLVLDSGSSRQPLDLLARLAKMAHTEGCQCALGDLNWGRLLPWRELTAEFFDPPDCRPRLDRIRQVRIEYETPVPDALTAQALLFVAWLATRLGWASLPSPWSRTVAGEQLSFRRGGQQVTVEMVALPARAEPALRFLALRADGEGSQAAFTIRRSPEGSQAETTTVLPGREVRQRVVSLPQPELAGLLGYELGRAGPDPVYQEALSLAASLGARHPSRHHVS